MLPDYTAASSDSARRLSGSEASHDPHMAEQHLNSSNESTAFPSLHTAASTPAWPQGLPSLPNAPSSSAPLSQYESSLEPTPLQDSSPHDSLPPQQLVSLSAPVDPLRVLLAPTPALGPTESASLLTEAVSQSPFAPPSLDAEPAFITAPSTTPSSFHSPSRSFILDQQRSIQSSEFNDPFQTPHGHHIDGVDPGTIVACQSHIPHHQEQDEDTDGISEAGVGESDRFGEATSEVRSHLIVPSALLLEDYVRTVVLLRPNEAAGSNNRYVDARALFDTGNGGENLISLELAKRLKLGPCYSRRSFWARLQSAVFPCAYDDVQSPAPRLQHLDTLKVRGCLNVAEIQWYGLDEDKMDQCIFFKPKINLSQFRVMKKLFCDVVICLPEIRRLRLNQQLVGGVRPEPPKANKSPAPYNAYKTRKEELKQLQRQIQASGNKSGLEQASKKPGSSGGTRKS